MSDEFYQKLHKDFAVSRETCEKLAKFSQILLEWNQKFNLIGRNTKHDVLERHIIDSLQLSKFLDKQDKIIDIGSGAGFPGLVLSIAGFNLTLVESIGKKCTFLNHVKQELGLDCTIMNERIENIKPINNSVITARAVAPLPKLLKLIFSHNKKPKHCLLFKGKNYLEEINEAEKTWKFKYKRFKSVTANESVILEIKDIKWK